MAKKKKEEIVETTAVETIVPCEQSVFNYGLFERLYLDELQSRIFYIDDEVTNDVLHQIVMHIYKINGEDKDLPMEKRVPITIIVNSGGGSVVDGMGVIDAINASETPVVAVCPSYAYSMAFNIFTQAHYRVASKNATFMYHDGYEFNANVTSKVRDASKFMEKLDCRINKLIASKTKISSEWLADNARADNYWFADEGKEKGFVDAIVGEDISMSDIFGILCEETNVETEN